MTIGEARRLAAAALARAGIDEAGFEAELLLRHALGGIERAAFFAHLDRPLPLDVSDAFDAIMERRLAREPAAYITGSRAFYGLRLRVSPAVLIPRPETEMLVEAALARLGTARPEPVEGRARPRVLDVGTGSGALALAIAANEPSAQVVATDVSLDALRIAHQNACDHGVESRVAFVQADLLAGFRPRTPAGDATFEVIVANPPYVPTGEWERLEPELRDHEPRLALDGGPDGLDVVRRLLAQAAPFVEAGTALFVEIGDRQGEAAVAEARRVVPASARTAVRPDLAGRDRLLAVVP